MRDFVYEDPYSVFPTPKISFQVALRSPFNRPPLPHSHHLRLSLKKLPPAYYSSSTVFQILTQAIPDCQGNFASEPEIKDITDPDRYDYKRFPKVSERKNQFRNTGEGVKAMGDGIQTLPDKRAKEQKRVSAGYQAIYSFVDQRNQRRSCKVQQYQREQKLCVILNGKKHAAYPVEDDHLKYG